MLERFVYAECVGKGGAILRVGRSFARDNVCIEWQTGVSRVGECKCERCRGEKSF